MLAPLFQEARLSAKDPGPPHPYATTGRPSPSLVERLLQGRVDQGRGEEHGTCVREKPSSTQVHRPPNSHKGQKPRAQGGRQPHFSSGSALCSFLATGKSSLSLSPGVSDGPVPSVADPGLTVEGQAQGRNPADDRSESRLRTVREVSVRGLERGWQGAVEEAETPQTSWPLTREASL